MRAFRFTDDQRAFQQAVRDYLSKECTPADVRAAADTGEHDGDRWRGLAELGVVGLTVPEEHGGLGMTFLDLILLLEEAGYAALPEPLLEVAGVAAPLLVAAGDAEALRHLAAGDLVPELDADDLDAAARDRGAVGAGAMLVGVSARMIEMAVAYAQQREQFGQPIGRFQAVKHHLADCVVRVEFARPAVYRAAWSLTQRPHDDATPVHASMAKVLATEAAEFTAKAALQVHGAIGYTHEHDLHLWMQRVWSLAACHGTADEHRARIRRSVLA